MKVNGNRKYHSIRRQIDIRKKTKHEIKLVEREEVEQDTMAAGGGGRSSELQSER